MSLTSPSLDFEAASRPNSLRRRLAPFVRSVVAAELAGGEFLAISTLLAMQPGEALPKRLPPGTAVAEFLPFVVVVALVVMCWSRRDEVSRLWQQTANARGWFGPFLVHLASFALLALATLWVKTPLAEGVHAPAIQFPLYVSAAVATGASLLRLAAPFAFWRGLVALIPREICIAASLAAVLFALGGSARVGWEGLAALTLRLVHAILTAYESWVVLDPAALTVRIGGFTHAIDPATSGYDGVTLVVVMLSLFLWSFRGRLQLRRALLLLPIGIGAILTVNAIRIAVLVSLGGHLAPELATARLEGETMGMTFLAVSIVIMVIASRIAFFARPSRSRQ